MKTRYYLLALSVVAVLGVLVFSHYRADAAGTDTKAFEASFKTLDGAHTVKLSDYRGKVVVVDVWATWCGFCVRAMPDLNAFHANVQEKGLPVKLIGVSVDRNAQIAQEFVNREKLGYTMVMGDQESLKPFGRIAGIPAKFILNKDGVLVERIVGATDRATLEKKIAPLLKEIEAEQKDKAK